VLRRLTTTILFLACAGPAGAAIAPPPPTADEGTTFHLFVGDQYTYDDNLYRIPASFSPVVSTLTPNATREDSINTVSGGGIGQWLFGRQNIDFSLRADYSRFAHNTALNNTGGDATVTWNWLVGPYFSGQVGAEFNRALASFAETRYLGRDLVDYKTYFGKGTFQVGPHWAIIGGARETDITHGAAAAVYVASSSPLDQYLVNHPEYFLGRDPEQGLIDPDNLLILSAHLQAATFELPLSNGEGFGQAPVAELLRILEEDGAVHQAGDAWHWSADAFPAEGVSLRSANADNVVIVDVTRGASVVGEMDQFSAPTFLHEEAIYLHEGAQYHVDRLDWEEKKAYVRPVKVDYYTDANLAVSIKVLETFASRPAEELTVHHGEVRVTALPTIFKKIRFHTHENVGSGPISLPEQQLHTTAFWLEIPAEVARQFPRPAMQGALQGVANVVSQVACLFLMCDARDLGAYSETRAPHTGTPAVFVYERYPGGVGMSARLFETAAAVIGAAHDLVLSCGCESGCPSCVGPALEVGEEGKAVALRLLELAALATAAAQ